MTQQVTNENLENTSKKVKQIKQAEKEALSNVKLQNNVSYYRKYTTYQWVTGIIAFCLCFWNAFIALIFWIIAWCSERKVKVSPVGNSSIWFTIPKKQWKEYRESHNLPIYKQYYKNHIADKDIDDVNQEHIDKLENIRKQEKEAKQEEKAQKNALYQQAVEPFKENKAQKIGRYYFDTKQQKIFKDATLLDKDYKTYDFSDIISYTPIEEGHSKTKKHGITRAVVGGALAGGAGAVVGAVTGGKNFDYVDKLGVVITFKNNENIRLMLLNSETKKGGFVANTYYKEFHNICGILDGVINQNTIIQTQQLSDSSANKISSADEIAKFKKLLDNGTITQEEFDAKKKQLLGL